MTKNQLKVHVWAKLDNVSTTTAASLEQNYWSITHIANIESKIHRIKYGDKMKYTETIKHRDKLTDG